MAASETAIANMALAYLGSTTIASLADTSTEATFANLFFDQVRAQVMREHPWNFAKVRAQLAALVDTPEHTYAYQYQLPTDCLRLLEVKDCYDWKVESGHILCDLKSPIYITYIKDETDVTKWDSLFTQTVVYKLAAELAYAITADAKKRAELYQEYMITLQTAKKVDGSEDVPDEFGIWDNNLARTREDFWDYNT